MKIKSTSINIKAYNISQNLLHGFILFFAVDSSIHKIDVKDSPWIFSLVYKQEIENWNMSKVHEINKC